MLAHSPHSLHSVKQDGCFRPVQPLRTPILTANTQHRTTRSSPCPSTQLDISARAQHHGPAPRPQQRSGRSSHTADKATSPSLRLQPPCAAGSSGSSVPSSSSPSSSPSSSSSTLPLPLKLRQGTAADLPIIAVNVLKEWLNPLGLNPTRFVVATTTAGPQDQEQIMGWGQLKSMEANGSGTVWELATLVTLPAYRGQGVATAVVRALLSRVGPSDRVLLLTTTRTASFYQKLGFQILPKGAPLPSVMAAEYALGSVIAPVVTGGERLVVLEACRD